MTNLITEARELCEKATPGPWWYQDKEKWLGHGDRENYRGGVLVNAEYDWEDQEAVLEIKPSDAALIARSRALIPELCDALEKATEKNDELIRELAQLARESVEREKNLARLEAEVMAACNSVRWVPVAERLPEIRCVEVLAIDKKGVLMASVDRSADGVWFGTNRAISGDVTHWMPLPAAPEEGEAE